MKRSAFFALGLAFALVVTGCGTKYHDVKGTVKLDGEPVDGAAVTLLTEDGKKSYSGVSDASGNFTILGGDKPGAPAGSYKVTVIKTKRVEAGATETGGEAYMKQMKEMGKGAMGSSKAGPMKGPPIPGAGGGSAAGLKSDLPAIYGAASTTTLKATIPMDGPLNLDLKSKP